jgi:hypothetical protein
MGVVVSCGLCEAATPSVMVDTVDTEGAQTLSHRRSNSLPERSSSGAASVEVADSKLSSNTLSSNTSIGEDDSGDGKRRDRAAGDSTAAAHAARPANASKSKKARPGLWKYEKYLELELDAMPVAVGQIPDVFVHLYDTQVHKRVSYFRITAEELLAMSPTVGKGATDPRTGTIAAPQWVELEHDWSWGSRGATVHPGLLLVKLQLQAVPLQGSVGSFSDGESDGGSFSESSGGEAEAEPNFQLPPAVEQTRQYPQLPSPTHPRGKGHVLGPGQAQVKTQFLSNCAMPTARFQVQVNCYSGRELPASDATGLLDPYLTIELGGRLRKTGHQRQTRDPHWFEAIVLDDVELPLNSRFAPPLVVGVACCPCTHARALNCIRFYMLLPAATLRLGPDVRRCVWLCARTPRRLRHGADKRATVESKTQGR